MQPRYLFSLLLGLAAGCGGQSTPAPIYVGHVATLSGPERHAGEQAMRGIRLAVQDQVAIADKDNLRPVHVVHTDTRGKLDAFEGEAIRLVSVNRVVALIGGDTPAEVVRLDRAHVPLVSASGLRTREMSNMVFLTGLSPAYRGSVLARYLVHELKATAGIVALVDEGREEGLELAESFAADVAAHSKAGRPRLRRFSKDRSAAELAKVVAEAGPGVLLFAGAAADLPPLLKELKSKPAVVLFGGAETSARVLQESPEAAGVYLATAYVRDPDLPLAKEFAARFLKATSAEPDADAALAHDASRLLFKAIRHCDAELTPERIRKELAELKDFPGLTGPLTFKDGQLQRPAFIVRLDRGKSVLVKKYAPDQDR